MSKKNQTPTLNNMGFLRLNAVCDLIGLGKTTVWTLSRNDPEFPKPVKLSTRCTAWRADELNAWIDSRERVQFKGVSNA